jgi:hypothetical protein
MSDTGDSQIVNVGFQSDGSEAALAARLQAVIERAFTNVGRDISQEISKGFRNINLGAAERQMKGFTNDINKGGRSSRRLQRRAS